MNILVVGGLVFLFWTVGTFFMNGLPFFPNMGGSSFGPVHILIFLLNLGLSSILNIGLLFAVLALVKTVDFLSHIKSIAPFSPITKFMLFFPFFIPFMFWHRLTIVYAIELSNLTHLDIVFLLSGGKNILSYLQNLTWVYLIVFLAINFMKSRLKTQLSLTRISVMIFIVISLIPFPLATGGMLLTLNVDPIFRDSLYRSQSNPISRILIMQLFLILDRDGDGYLALFESDCDETNAKINLGALEIPNNGIDDNCMLGDWDGKTFVEGSKHPQAFSSTRDPFASEKNLLFIVIDAMRPDRLQFNGYHRSVAPNLDRFANHSIVFTDTLTQFGVTNESFSSIFSGEYRNQLKEKPLLRAFVDAGYHSKAVTSCLHKDIDIIDTAYKEALGCSSPAEEVLDIGLKFLEKTDSPSLLLLHFLDAHSPYLNSPDFEFGDEIHDYYDEELATVDLQIGKLFHTMKEMGIWEDTVTVIISDHGECMGDCRFGHRTTYVHGEGISPNEAKVVFMMHIPDRKPMAVSHPVELIDIMPTLFDLFGITYLAKINGRSLTPLIFGDSNSYTYRKRFTGSFAWIVNYSGYYLDDYFFEFNRFTNRLRMYETSDPQLRFDLSEVRSEEFEKYGKELFLGIESLGL